VGDAALTAELDANPPLPPVPAPGNELRSAELDALQARSEHARAQAQAERRLGLPVNVGLGTRRVEDAGLRDDIVVVELGVALPVFDRNQAARLRTSAEAERADAEYRRARLRTRSRRTAAADEARQLSASARVLLDSAVPEAARLTAIARASFAEGELDLVGLLDAHEAQSAVVEQALEQQSRALDVVLELLQLSPTLLATDSSHQPSN
ncbi:MAG: TolC family protein, partial [Pseudomonadota bacterium]|nr:TolC family protein [Pseudomonadota bacterium]